MLLSGMPKVFIILLGFLNLCFCLRLTRILKNCDNATGGTLNYLDISGCSIEPCKVHPNNQTRLTVKFTASKLEPSYIHQMEELLKLVPDESLDTRHLSHDTQITAARNDLMIQILNNPQWFHWPLIDHTNCGHGLKWLIMPGQVAVFTVSLPSSPFPSSIKVPMKGMLKDGTGNNILCFIMPLELLPSN